MAIIDPDGLFSGNRLRRCSDNARLFWPYFFLASNGYGRIELDYCDFCRRALAGFRRVPTEEEFWAYVKEYRDAHLLFLYEREGQVWGQWDVKKGCLPRWPTRKDKCSPTPPEPAFGSWLKSYRAESKPLPKSAEFLREIPKVLQNPPLGVGVGVGVGEGEKHPPKPPAGAASLFPDAPMETPQTAGPQGRHSRRKDSADELERKLGDRLAWWAEFWSVYPCKEGKLPAMRNFEAIVRTEALWREVLAGARAYAERFKRDPTMKLKYAQGWLTDARWTDDQAPASTVVPRRLMAGVTA